MRVRLGLLLLVGAAVVLAAYRHRSRPEVQPVSATDPVLMNGYWRCAVVTAGWPELSRAEVWFEPAAGNRAARPTAAQLAALQQLLAESEAARLQVTAALAGDYSARVADSHLEGAAATAAVADGPLSRARLDQVIVWRSAAIGFDFVWDIDVEHGLGVRWADGRVVAVGVAEVAHP